VVLLGTALAFISIMLAIAAARGVAEVLSGGWAWFGAAFAASLVFALVESVEFMFAEWLQERRGEPVEPDQ
jgi:xanthine/uracil permease